MSDVGADAKEQANRLCEAKGWSLGALLGKGGSAAVFEVTTEAGDTALKVFFPRFIEGREGAITRKRLEIVKDRLIGHACPTLVRIHAIDEFEGAPFMVMEHVAGSMLTDVLRLVPAPAVEGIVRQIAEAAKYLEDLGLTHRDIKSDNIMVDATLTKATLVDVGVARIIDDPVGSGTDDDGKLPFVATARYSSPEYMFRLAPPGPELWRALNFYQLGGLIHDLLCGEPLFEEVVRQAASNRYLIAYAVATDIPHVKPRNGVPDYLVNLAQRCLQKDLAPRLASVSWEDFFGRDRQRENEALLGIRGDRISSSGVRTLDVAELGRSIENSIDNRLMAKGLSCRHSTTVIHHTRVDIRIRWTPPKLPPDVEIEVLIDLSEIDGQLRITASSQLRPLSAKSFEAPVVAIASDAADLELSATNQVYDLFLEASAKLIGGSDAKNGGAAN
ncbi:MAG: protein kinase [Rhizobiales bacterium]|nr:protein kinase [Hyphomicrobiales bacterium]